MRHLGCENMCRRMKRKLQHLLLRPIRVFVFHQTSAEFDASTMWSCDWTEISAFKNRILSLRKDYTFISLQDATYHLENDKIRSSRYAVLTADDGWKSVLNILPWLSEHNIPLTLFLNPCYLDGVHKQERDTEQLLTYDEIREILSRYPGVSIASHGWDHKKCLEMSDWDFEENIEKANNILIQFKGFIPFYAFTFGAHTPNQVEILHHHHLIPVLVDGMQNYAGTEVIHRECIDNS